MISQILQRSDNDVKNRWNSKGYAHYRNALKIGNLIATTSLLNECAADMTSIQRAAHAASLRLLGSIPPEILAPFELTATDNPAMISVRRDQRSECEILKPTRFPGDMEAETAGDILYYSATHNPWNKTDQTNSPENDEDYIRSLVALERLPCPSQSTIERSVSWATGIAFLERCDTLFGNPATGYSLSTIPSPTCHQLEASTYCSSDSVPYLEPAAVYPTGDTPNARAAPPPVEHSCLAKTRNFRGRTFFSPGEDEDADGIMSPFGISYCV